MSESNNPVMCTLHHFSAVSSPMCGSGSKVNQKLVNGGTAKW